MKLPRLFRMPEHYIFDYKPLYYDERKEKREKREQTIKNEIDGASQKEDYKTNIKGSFKHTMSYKQNNAKSSTLRLIILLVFIAILIYFIFFTGIIDNLFNAF